MRGEEKSSGTYNMRGEVEPIDDKRSVAEPRI